MAKTEPRIVSATGTASATAGLGKRIEKAMSDAASAAAKETEAIWADESISEEDRQAKIAAIMDPAEIKKRMLLARDAVTAGPVIAAKA